MSTSLAEQNVSGAINLTATAHPLSLRTGETLLRLLRRAWNSWERVECQVERWQQTRQLLGVDESMLKDIGVPRCGAEWAARYGRDD